MLQQNNNVVNVRVPMARPNPGTGDALHRVAGTNEELDGKHFRETLPQDDAQLLTGSI
jgi:hypothetical protein